MIGTVVEYGLLNVSFTVSRTCNRIPILGFMDHQQLLYLAPMRREQGDYGVLAGSQVNQAYRDGIWAMPPLPAILM